MNDWKWQVRISSEDDTEPQEKLCAHNTKDHRTPEEWEKITGIKILDADGWSGKNGRPWTDPIGYVEWNRRMSASTVQRNAFRKSKVQEMLEQKRRDLIREILAEFDHSYTYFLLDRRFADSAVVRAAFYSACIKIVEQNPIPDERVQEKVLKSLTDTRDNSVGEYVESVEMLFSDMSSRRRG